MLDPQVADEQREKVAAEAKGKLESQGELVHEANWGLRKMAYEIDRRGEADYRFYRFAGDKALLDDLDHSLKITDGVLRFRIFKADRDAPLTVPPDTEVIMRREEDDRERGGGRGGPRRGRDDRGDRGGERRDRPAPAASSPAPAAEASAPAPPADPAEAAPVAAEPAEAAPEAAPAADASDPAS